MARRSKITKQKHEEKKMIYDNSPVLEEGTDIESDLQKVDAETLHVLNRIFPVIHGDGKLTVETGPYFNYGARKLVRYTYVFLEGDDIATVCNRANPRPTLMTVHPTGGEGKLMLLMEWIIRPEGVLSSLDDV
ncbi:MAG: hypothetical protein Q8M92_02320 [Candidatus Subteraquimicrobiales bacterium]|nr:hypothetical protein [Candidatus Subteraquimicrobiales bacterium]